MASAHHHNDNDDPAAHHHNDHDDPAAHDHYYVNIFGYHHHCNPAAHHDNGNDDRVYQLWWRGSAGEGGWE